MPKFVTDRDKSFFQGINNEIINDVIDTTIVIYKLSITDNPDDIYGESINKYYSVGIILNCIIDKQNQTVTEEEFGPVHAQTMLIAINREHASDKNIYPEIGDIIDWNNFYYEIDNVYENQYITERTSYNWAIMVNSHLTNKSNINIEERHR